MIYFDGYADCVNYRLEDCKDQNNYRCETQQRKMLQVCKAAHGYAPYYYSINNEPMEFFSQGLNGFDQCEAARSKSCEDNPNAYVCEDGIVTCKKGQDLWSYRIND